MNRALVVALGVFASCAEPVKPTTTVVTLVGEPSGTATTVRIGRAGGTLTTPQGELTIRVPAGALGDEVDLSATPITSKVPGAVGGAWRLGPEGTTFSSPVSLAFKYTTAMVTGTTVKHLQVASQNADRTWTYASERTVDSSEKTITVQSTHFSDWSLARDDGSAAQLASRRVMVKYVGPVSVFPVQMTVEDTVSVVLQAPLVNGFFGPGNPDGPIPDAIEVKNEITALGAVNDVRAGCPEPSLLGNVELLTVTGIQVFPPRIILVGDRDLPGIIVGAGENVCGAGTSKLKPSTTRMTLELPLTSSEWDSTGETTLTRTDSYDWTWTIGPN